MPRARPKTPPSAARPAFRLRLRQTSSTDIPHNIRLRRSSSPRAKSRAFATKRGFRTGSRFRHRVLAVVSRIPSGRVMTYREVARCAGRPRAYRAVGNILHVNRDPRIPCHRVIRSDGRPGDYNRGTREKIRRLRKEGVVL